MPGIPKVIGLRRRPIYSVIPLRSLSTHLAAGVDVQLVDVPVGGDEVDVLAWMYSSWTCPSAVMKLTC